MKEQRFLTYHDQIALLKQQGMTVSDEKAAAEILAEVGYYELVNGYKRIFKDPRTGKYRPGVTFEELYALYKCDENLRQLFFKYMLRIEIHMRSILSYAFCEQFGERQQAYLNRDNYDTEGDCAHEVSRLIGELDYAANRADKAVYVRHHRNTYHNVPLWVLFKTLSLGTLNRFLRCCRQDIRIYAARQFPDLRENTLCRMLDVMQDFRNVCAHNDCLYTYKSEGSIPVMPVLRSVAVPAFREGRPYEGRDLFALMVVFRYLLDENDYSRASDAVERILAHFSAQCASVDSDEVLAAMGFPPDWRNLGVPQKR
ncbi:MAG: Abi family protein [Clostridia bacterium]|nr:Abi family protein [Clostridia bacterium]